MKKRSTLLAALAVAFGAFYAYRAYASMDAEGGDKNPWLPPPAPGTLTPEENMISIKDATPEQRLAAGLALIRKFESNGQYDVLYGGGKFDSMDAHPNVHVPFTDPRTGKDNYSTAAGAYQINFPTWRDEIQPANNFPDFTPPSQDAAAIYLLKKIGAYDALVAGDIDTFLRRASRKWASLPYSTAQQHPQALQAALDSFTDFLSIA
jgi:muramidase (phage lysozyme)